MLNIRPVKFKIEARYLIFTAVLVGLVITSRYSYLLFHSLVEILSVVVAATITIITWAARRSLQNGYLLFLGATFLYIGIFDTIHTLAYKGMPVFPGYDANLPTQLWIASRYLLGGAFLIAPLFLRRKVNFGLMASLLAVVSGLLLAFIFLGIFPASFIEGTGLTPFKIYSEYLIAVLLAIGLAALRRHKSAFDPSVMRWLTLSLALNILAGIAFTEYVSVFDFANLTGHLLKTAAYFFLFRAIVETGFYQPLVLLLRELKQSETSLLQAQSSLEKRVEERTHQLAQANLDLRSQIEERLKAEDALRESEARFRTIFEKTSMGIILVGVDGIIQAANPGMGAILDTPREEILGKHVTEITYPDDIPASQQFIQRLARGELFTYDLDKRYINRQGEPIWTHLSITVVQNDDGSPRFMIGIIKDISESRRSAEELREIQRRLMNSKEEERLRVARDLHDGPMQEVLAMVYELSHMSLDASPEEQKKFKALSDQLCSVNQSLRTITGELRPQALAPFGLEKAIRSHAETLQQANPTLTIRLKLMPDGQAFPEITRIALYRVYRQSMDNIIQHSRAGTAAVTFKYDAESIWLEIADDGEGFEPPSRWIQLVRSGHFGLAGMWERVEALGGRLEIESAPGQGTRILVTVPRPTESAAEDAEFEEERV